MKVMKKIGGITCGRCHANDYMLFNIDGKIYTICKVCSLVSLLYNGKKVATIEGKKLIEAITKQIMPKKEEEVTEKKKSYPGVR